MNRNAGSRKTHISFLFLYILAPILALPILSIRKGMSPRVIRLTQKTIPVFSCCVCAVSVCVCLKYSCYCVCRVDIAVYDGSHICEDRLTGCCGKVILDSR